MNNLLVAVHIAAAAEAMALGLRSGVDVELMIKAIATGSGGSSSFAQRAPRMAQRKFEPPMGTASQLAHYFDLIGDSPTAPAIATPMLNQAIELYRRLIAQGHGDRDVARLLDVIEGMKREKPKSHS